MCRFIKFQLLFNLIIMHQYDAKIILKITMLEYIKFLSSKLFHIFYYSYTDKDAPCVGLCFHNKLQALEEKDDDYSRGWPLNSKDFVDQPPCVGLCQMFRELNIPNPFHKYQHTGTKPTPMPTTKSPLSPLT